MKTKTLILFILIISTQQIKCQEISLSSERIINSTIRIECWRDTMINGVKKSYLSTGTGFFFGFIFDSLFFPVIVTNAHVIKNMDKGILNFTEAVNNGPKYGSILRDTISYFKNKWIFHPSVDLAILPLKPIIQDLFNKKKKIRIIFV